MLKDSVVADWLFTRDFIESGSLDDGDLILTDASGNKNDIRLVVIGDQNDLGQKDLLKWCEETQSLAFNNRIGSGIGQYFETIDTAPLNRLTFETGYTIECILELPSGSYDSWMGILTRDGAASDIGKLKGEKEILTTLSYNDLFQWACHPLNLDYDRTNWSLWNCRNYRSGFHCVTIVNDGTSTKMYLNGIADIRNPIEEMKGIDLVEGKGWLIGAAKWDNHLSGLFSGQLKRIRISNKALERNDWLVPHPTPTYPIKGSNQERNLLNKPTNYNIVFIPDTQYMGQIAPQMVTCITEWIAQNHRELNIKATLHLGDITEEAVEDEYRIMDNTFNILDNARCPYFVTPGNHDLKDGGCHFTKYFGATRYIDKGYFREASPEGNSFYGIIEAGSYAYMIIALDYDHIEHSVEWAQHILEVNTQKPTIIITHDAYYSFNGKLGRTANGQYIWDNLVNQYNQIFMVAAGHIFGADHAITKNPWDNEVVELLIDYQAYPSGGNSWIQLAECDEENGCISFKTYSPWVKQLNEEDKTYYDLLYLDSEKDEFIIPFDFKRRFDF